MFLRGFLGAVLRSRSRVIVRTIDAGIMKCSIHKWINKCLPEWMDESKRKMAIDYSVKSSLVFFSIGEKNHVCWTHYFSPWKWEWLCSLMFMSLGDLSCFLRLRILAMHSWRLGPESPSDELSERLGLGSALLLSVSQFFPKSAPLLGVLRPNFQHGGDYSPNQQAVLL